MVVMTRGSIGEFPLALHRAARVLTRRATPCAGPFAKRAISPADVVIVDRELTRC
jgi:hypothetical protein